MDNPAKIAVSITAIVCIVQTRCRLRDDINHMVQRYFFLPLPSSAKNAGYLLTSDKLHGKEEIPFKLTDIEHLGNMRVL